MAVSTSVEGYIKANARRFLEEFKELLAYPSISNHGDQALRPCREWLGNRLASLTDRIEVIEEGGLPAIWAEIPGDGSRTLLLYQHYDVQPVDPVSAWESPPFEAAERDGRIFARGAADDKADVMARIHALEALRATRGRPPLTVRMIVEGEEEVGSKSFERITERHSEKLQADGCLWESAGFSQRGRPSVMFGVRGLLYVELRTRTMNFDQHSGGASLYPSAAALMVAALASLRDLDMNIRIAGFYDGIVSPTAEDRRLMESIELDLDAARDLIGHERLLRDVAPQWAVEQLLFMPTCNFAGITTGYQGPGSKTVLPAEASAKLDFRLVPDQDPGDVLAKLRTHLDLGGFQAVEIAWADGEKPARSDPGSEVGRAVVDEERRLFGEPEIWPFMAATGPMHPITAGLGVPAVMPTGAGRPDSRVHAPDENVRIQDYLNSVLLNCRILERFGSA